MMPLLTPSEISKLALFSGDYIKYQDYLIGHCAEFQIGYGLGKGLVLHDRSMHCVPM